MSNGHPLVWGTVLVTAVSMALSTTNLVILATLVAILLMVGKLAGGPRRASMTIALGLSLVACLVWFGYTLLVPRHRGGPSLVELPQIAVGPGVTLGGSLTLAGMLAGLASALSAVAVILAFGLAGQVVPARGWLALARSCLGPFTPAVAWGCCLGTSARSALGVLRSPAHVTTSLQTWFTASARTAETILPTIADPPAFLHRLRGAIVLVLASLPIVYWYLRRPMADGGLSGIDALTLVGAGVVGIGLVLPGAPAELRRWTTTDVFIALPVTHLAVVWALRGTVMPALVLRPTDHVGGDPPVWLLLALVLVPISMVLTPTPSLPAVHHA